MTYEIVKDAVQESVTAFHLTDQSDWGLGGNPARNLRALKLFVTKTDKDGGRTLLTVVPDSADPLAVTAWDCSIALDGLIEKILFVVQLYGAGVNYVTDDIFYYSSTGKYYKATQASIGQTPTNQTYFSEVAEDDLYDNEIANDCTTMEVEVLDDLITGTTEENLDDLHEAETDQFNNGKFSLQYNKADYIDSMLNGAYAALDAGRKYEAEEIIRGIANYLLVLS